jgi:type IV pilus assembly protein PilA
MDMRKPKGFSLLELLIVVAIILIVAAIAIPNLQRTRMSANEASAVASMRSINNAEIAYAASYPETGFSANLLSLGGANPCTQAVAHACLLDDSLAKSTTMPKSGYRLTYAAAGGSGTAADPYNAYTLTGEPVNRGQTGQRGFWTDNSGVIRAEPTAAATGTSAPLQ